MTLRVLAVPIMVICGAILLVLATVHPNMTPPSAAALQATCSARSGGGVTGTLPQTGSYSDHAIIQILPALPYGAVYLDALRRRLGIPVTTHSVPGTAIGLTQFATVMRYARADKNGRFVCRPLDPGQYVAVATTPLGPGAVAVKVATFDLAAQRGLANLTNDRFRPLQDIR